LGPRNILLSPPPVKVYSYFGSTISRCRDLGSDVGT
jgi:hypothetical protein